MKKALFVFIFVFFVNGYAFAKINVVTTTFLLSSVVQSIGGRYVNSTYLIPVGSNPHIFSPRPKSLIKLAKANLFIGVGYGFEFWISSIREFLKNKDVMFLSEFYKNPMDKRNINDFTIANPHIWLDLNFMSEKAVFAIAKKLCAFDYAHCRYFKINASLLSHKIRSIQRMYEKELLGKKQYCFVDLKPAFEYLLKSVGVHSCCVVIKKGNEEPKISDIAETFNRCKCKKGVVLYISNEQLAKTIAEKLHYSYVSLNPLGDNKKLNTYPKLLMYNLDRLKKALR